MKLSTDLRESLARVVNGEPPIGWVRDEILTSWRQSAAFGLRPDRFDPPNEGGIDLQSAFSFAAGPVVHRLSEHLSTADVSVVLSDEHAHVIGRRSANPREERRLDDLALAPGFGWRTETTGTNALGVSCVERKPMLVEGPEHFMEALLGLTEASAPISDPRTGQLLGAVTLASSADAANSLLLPVAHIAAYEIEQRLLDGRSARNRLLDEHFLRARRRTRGPLALVGEHTLLMNAAASRILRSEDRAQLWNAALSALNVMNSKTSTLLLPDGASHLAAIEPVHDGCELAGALIRLPRANSKTEAHGASAHKPRTQGPTLGWQALTETEHSLAELVAEGLTNKEAAKRLFLSHHTIDSHLRHIFTKLDIKSRVELARLVTARHSHEMSQPSSERTVA